MRTDAEREQLTADFCMQYLLRRPDIEAVAKAFAAALEEDHRVNADMFDTTSTVITGNRHANGTMRALEKRLAASDLPLLRLLSSLILVGADVCMGLADFADAAAFAGAAAEEFAGFERRGEDAPRLAAGLTVPKAEHQVRRLRTAMEWMDRARV